MHHINASFGDIDIGIMVITRTENDTEWGNDSLQTETYYKIRRDLERRAAKIPGPPL